jgi:hypothetical protein
MPYEIKALSCDPKKPGPLGEADSESLGEQLRRRRETLERHQVIRTYNFRDVVITLLDEAGQWKTGENDFVVEFDSATMKRLIDVGSPTLTVTLGAAVKPPLRVSARLRRGDIPGRYRGTITLPRTGEWLVTITWDAPASKGSATFPVSVEARGAS